MRRPAWPARAAGSISASATMITAGRCSRGRICSTPTRAPATRTASPPAGCRIFSAGTVRAWRSIPPVRRPWLRCIWRVRPCAWANAIWRSTGGINLILTPDMNICFSKARMMAADGRCKTFDAAADGYVRSEGCGMVVLRRLVRRCGGRRSHPRGRAGQRGQSGWAQWRADRAEWSRAAGRHPVGTRGSPRPPDAIGYLEAHGTGTPLGDPIEIGAIGAVFGPGRTAGQPLAVGSVKTNLGHLEGGGRHRRADQGRSFPATPGNPAAPAPRDRQSAYRLGGSADHRANYNHAVCVERRSAPRPAVSSFGFSGCNAHVILEEAPPSATAAPSESERPLASCWRCRHVTPRPRRAGAALPRGAGR